MPLNSRKQDVDYAAIDECYLWGHAHQQDTNDSVFLTFLLCPIKFEFLPCFQESPFLQRILHIKPKPYKARSCLEWKGVFDFRRLQCETRHLLFKSMTPLKFKTMVSFDSEKSDFGSSIHLHWGRTTLYVQKESERKTWTEPESVPRQQNSLAAASVFALWGKLLAPYG